MKLLLALCVVLAACHHSDSPPANPPTGNTDTTGSGSATTASCPPALQPDVICAAVVTYAKASDGTCCMYPSPCSVPMKDGAQYSDDKCTTAMGGGAPQ